MSVPPRAIADVFICKITIIKIITTIKIIQIIQIIQILIK